MQEHLVAAGLFVAAFLLGSIPWGLVISTVFFHTDIRQHGSGNIGTTNAMRTIGKAGGAAVFVLDFGKGLLSGVLAWAFSQYLLPGAGLVPERPFPTTPCWPWRSSAAPGATSSARGSSSRAARASRWPWAACS